MTQTKFSIQIHWQKKNRSSHFDLRVLSPGATKLWSWALPKSKFPGKGERLLAIRTPDHRPSHMYFVGTLKNGDKVSLHDKGDCDILTNKYNLITLRFKGTKEIGTYTLIKISGSKDNGWIMLRNVKQDDKL